MSHVFSQVVTWTRLEWQRHHVEHEDAIMAQKKKKKEQQGKKIEEKKS